MDSYYISFVSCILDVRLFIVEGLRDFAFGGESIMRSIVVDPHLYGLLALSALLYLFDIMELYFL